MGWGGCNLFVISRLQHPEKIIHSDFTFCFGASQLSDFVDGEACYLSNVADGKAFGLHLACINKTFFSSSLFQSLFQSSFQSFEHFSLKNVVLDHDVVDVAVVGSALDRRTPPTSSFRQPASRLNASSRHTIIALFFINSCKSTAFIRNRQILTPKSNGSRYTQVPGAAFYEIL